MLDFHLVKALHSAAGPAVLDVALRVEPGELVALVGPSGAGKTTLLRLLAGLTRPDAGYLRVAGQPWYEADRQQWLAPARRPIGFVFQDYALFPHMTVEQNLLFALPDPRHRAPVTELLQLMELTALARRYPAELSGGQQQRVALARALARQPRLLLLDEPLSAVDAATRQQLQQALAEIHRRLGLTTLLVSHDAAEVHRLASRVLTLELGCIVGDGPPTVPATDGPFLMATVLEVLPPQLRVQLPGHPAPLLLPVPDAAAYQPGNAIRLRLSAETALAPSARVPPTG